MMRQGLVLIFVLLLAACNARSSGSTAAGRVIVLGLDGMDHGIVSQMLDKGELPSLARLAQQGGFRPLQTSIPPQSPTAWSNFITGMRPGHHGIFDFIHCDQEEMLPYLSTSRTDPPSRITIGSLAIPLGGGGVHLLRQQKPFWSVLSHHGVPATVIRIPSHFPPKDDGDARVLSGMGTPDLLGTYGTFTLLTTDENLLQKPVSGGRIVPLEHVTKDRFRGVIEGPEDPLSAEDEPISIAVEVLVDEDAPGALVILDDQKIVLGQGEWSDFVSVEFPVLYPLYGVQSVVRLYLKSVSPHLTVYMSPLNLDPMDPALPISSPPDFARHLAEKAGRFYTQGMPEDTKALAGGVLSAEEFLQQARLVLEQRKRLLNVALEEHRQGFLFFYFSSTDQITHMFFRAHDPDHPARTEQDEPYAGVIKQIYRELDRVVGKVHGQLGKNDLLVVISDHGFGPASYLVDLNRWLNDRGYLALRDDPTDDLFGQIDWSRTQAYGLGLNGLYINLKGRERHGVVPLDRKDTLLQRLARELSELRHPTSGQQVITSTTRPDKLYPGPAIGEAPDLIVGYGRGFKVSDQSAQGAVGQSLFEINRGAWSGDHCGDHRFVPGILLASRRLRGGETSLVDMAPTFLKHFGIEPPSTYVGRSVLEHHGAKHGQDQDR